MPPVEPAKFAPVCTTELCTIHPSICSSIRAAVLAPHRAAFGATFRATNIETKYTTVEPAILGAFKPPLDEFPFVRAVDAAQRNAQWVSDHAALRVAFHATFEPTHSSSIGKT